MVLLKYHRKGSGSGVRGRRCTAPWITLIGMILVVVTLKGDLRQYILSCKGCIRGWWLFLTITTPAVWRIGPVANVRTNAGSPLMLNSASAIMKQQFNYMGMRVAVDFKRWRSGLIPIQGSAVSFLGGLCFLHLVDPVQWTIWTAYPSHWKDITGIATVL